MLRYSLLSAGLLLGFSALAAPAGDLPLMPWPASVTRPAEQGALVLNNQLTIRVSGDDGDEIITQLRQRIARQTGWTLQPQAANPANATITIAIAHKVAPIPALDSDERYTLTIDRSGAKIAANTRFGAQRGIETLLQLLQNSAEQTQLPWVTIEDAPRFRDCGCLPGVAERAGALCHGAPLGRIETGTRSDKRGDIRLCGGDGERTGGDLPGCLPAYRRR